MKVKKKRGLFEYNPKKIRNAIIAAYIQVATPDFDIIDELVNNINEEFVNQNEEIVEVEEIENTVMSYLYRYLPEVARVYSSYKIDKERAKKNPTEIEKVLYVDPEVALENGNKDPRLSHIQNAYLAEIPSKKMMKKLLPKDCWKAHEKGAVYFHDSSYSARPLHNCDLLNLEELFKGCRVNGVWISTPKSFQTACTVATQILTHATSNQYGGITINLLHLAKFVDVSRQKIKKEIEQYDLPEEVTSKMIEDRLNKEIKDGLQTFLYQNNTLCAGTGQAVFLSVSIWLNEEPKYKEDFKKVVREFLKQRIKGMPDENGANTNPNFPKILYFLEDDSFTDDIDTTRLAAECSAKRLTPDYMSVKKHMMIKGVPTPSMGCVNKNSVITYIYNNKIYVESFERAWDRLSQIYKVKMQPNNKDYYMETPLVDIYDNSLDKFIPMISMIKNHSSKWKEIILSNGRYIRVTNNHPFEVIDKGVVLAENLQKGDVILRNNNTVEPSKYNYFDEIAWLAGLILCDGCLSTHFSISLGLDEKEVAEKAIKILRDSNYDAKLEKKQRGTKGNYYDVVVSHSKLIRNFFIHKFEGETKNNRHIPNEIFNSNYDVRMSFLAGMIDADGYINSSGNTLHCQIGSVNEELSLQTMELARSCGLNAQIYFNHYNKKDPSKIRYRVEFNAIPEFKNYLICEKKKSHIKEHNFKPNCGIDSNRCIVKKIISYAEEDFSYDVSTESEHFTVNGIYSHNCRAWLSSYQDESGKYITWGRGNCGVATLNLPYIMMENNPNHNEEIAISNLEKYIDIANRDCLWRLNHVAKIKAGQSPLLWVYGGLTRLNPEDTLEEICYNGYMTVSIGFSGLYEAVKFITGENQWGEKGNKFAHKIFDMLNKNNDDMKEKTGAAFALYGTPMETTTQKFADACIRDFGHVGDGTQRRYITNSYHYPVFEQVDAFTKLKNENEFSDLSLGGSISYCEVPNLSNNIDVMLELMKFISDNCNYAEINSEISQCGKCGFKGYDFDKVYAKDGTLRWKCPNCGETDPDVVLTSYRICGYISNYTPNQGRSGDIANRVKHLNIE